MAAQDSDVEGGVGGLNVLSVRIVEAFGGEGILKFGEGCGRAHFLDGEDVDVHRFDGFANFGFGGIGLGAHGSVGRVEIKFEVVCADSELGGRSREDEQREEQCRCTKANHARDLNELSGGRRVKVCGLARTLVLPYCCGAVE